MTATLEKPVLISAERLVQQFKASSASPKWLQQLRGSALDNFAKLGFPTTRHEEWRFTNIAALLELPLHSANSASRAVTLEEIQPLIASKQDWPRLVFVDGHFSPELSSVAEKSKNFQAGSLAKRLLKDASELEAHLGKYAQSKLNAFAGLNTAFFSDGAFISVAAGKTLKKPFLLLFLSAANELGSIHHPRNLILAGAGSSFSVVEMYASLSNAACLTNSVTELVLGENSQIEHCKVQSQSEQSFHIATVHANQERDSRWTSHSISSGGRIARNQIETTLAGEGALAVLNGLYMGRGDQLVDHHTVVDHAKPNCESHEYYHGILDDRAHAVFNGKIFVREDAQKTNAKQNNRNLLLSDEAVVDTKPQLEIFADDVKCTHGATIGQMNDEQLFYLRARGIGLEAARQMLVRAFAATVIERIQIDAIRTELDQTLLGRFGGSHE